MNNTVLRYEILIKTAISFKIITIVILITSS